MLSTAHPSHDDDNDSNMMVMIMMVTMIVSSGDVSSSLQLAVPSSVCVCGVRC